MKNVVFSLTFIGFFALLIAGKMHWDEKIAESGLSFKVETTTASATEEEVEEVKKPLSDEKISDLMKNFPDATREKMISSSEPLSVVIVGSESIGNNEEGLNTVVEKGLEKSYWEDAFSVIQITLEKDTTSSLLKEKAYKKVLDRKPDIVIMESFTLNDNSLVTIEESHNNIKSFKDKIEASLSHASYILMPSNPIYDPGYYSVQISALNDFAENNEFTYLNHWEAWPPVKDNAIKQYLDGTRPTAEGFKVWGETIVDFMSGE